MPENKEIDDLAAQYLDLWQEQLGSLARKEDTAELMAKTLELMNSGSLAFSAMAQAASDSLAGQPGKDTQDASSQTQQIGPQTSAPASGNPDPNVAQLLKRIAALEERIIALESGPAKTGRKPARKSTKRSP